jgi:hypothetical protein
MATTTNTTTNNVNENNTVLAATLLSAVLNAVDSYDVALGNMAQAYEDRLNALGALRAKFKKIQGGGAARYGKAPLDGEYSYNSAVAEFTARFNKAWDAKLTPKQLTERALDDKKHRPSKAQIDNNNKQRVLTLGFWLKTGKFTNNVGKDKAKLEHVCSLERVDADKVAADEAIQNAKIATKQAADNKKAADKLADAIKKNNDNLKNAKAKDATAASLELIENKAKLLTSNLALAKADKLAADKIAAKAEREAAAAKAKLDASNLAAEQAREAAAAKAAKSIDLKKMASDLSGKLNAEQIQTLIDLLAATL